MVWGMCVVCKEKSDFVSTQKKDSVDKKRDGNCYRAGRKTVAHLGTPFSLVTTVECFGWPCSYPLGHLSSEQYNGSVRTSAVCGMGVVSEYEQLRTKRATTFPDEAPYFSRPKKCIRYPL